jgi:hypothetical protein
MNDCIVEFLRELDGFEVFSFYGTSINFVDSSVNLLFMSNDDEMFKMTIFNVNSNTSNVPFLIEDTRFDILHHGAIGQDFSAEDAAYETRDFIMARRAVRVSSKGN